LQALFQALAPPFAAFRHHFTFDVGQSRQGLGVWFHEMTRLAWFEFMPVEEPNSLYPKDSVKMHPG
jgi:hypothetical protein